MKGLLVYHAVQPTRTHDLVALLQECAASEPGLESLLEDCRLLTLFAVQARYPEDLAEPGESDGRAALEALERVRQAIQGCLPDPEGLREDRGGR